MTNNRNYYAQNNYEDHSTFGGTISNFDFDGYNSMIDIANKIISDWKFNEQCRKNVEQRNRQKLFQKGNN